MQFTAIPIVFAETNCMKKDNYYLNAQLAFILFQHMNQHAVRTGRTKSGSIKKLNRKIIRISSSCQQCLPALYYLEHRKTHKHSNTSDRSYCHMLRLLF